MKVFEVRTDIEFIWNYFGYFYNEKGELDEAIKYYKKAIELNHFFPVARINLARAYLNNNEIEKSIECYDILIEKFPIHAEALYDKARIESNRNNA